MGRGGVALQGRPAADRGMMWTGRLADQLVQVHPCTQMLLPPTALRAIVPKLLL
jgi:hypothetical protein